MSKTPNIFVRSLRELRSTRCLAVTALLIAINVTLEMCIRDSIRVVSETIIISIA